MNIEMRDLHVVFVTLYGGAHGETASGCPESNNVYHSSITYYDNNLWSPTADLREGGYAIDRRGCQDSLVGMHFPHLDCLLTGRKVRFSAWGEPTEYSGKVGIEALKMAGVHDISPDLYAELNHYCGALVGVRKGNTIVWRHGVITNIPKESERKKYNVNHVDPWLVK